MNIIEITVRTILYLAIIFFIGFLVGHLKESCDELDANCDGQINLQDFSIHMWRADQFTQ